MAELFYVGLSPSAGRDTETYLRTRNQLNAGVSRIYVNGRVVDYVSGTATGQAYATKVYVDTQDGTFATADYYQAQDALLVPTNAKNNPNGVAGLVAGKIPDAQIPVLGTGILRGPLPISHVYGGNTFVTPFKIADWEIGDTGIACQPWVFLTTTLLSTGGRPVVEVRAGTPTQTSYVSQTMVAQGYGRSLYYDYQTVEVLPQDPDLNESQAAGDQDFFPSSMNMTLTVWMYDDAGGQVSTPTAPIMSGAAYLARTQL